VSKVKTSKRQVSPILNCIPEEKRSWRHSPDFEILPHKSWASQPDIEIVTSDSDGSFALIRPLAKNPTWTKPKAQNVAVAKVKDEPGLAPARSGFITRGQYSLPCILNSDTRLAPDPYNAQAAGQSRWPRDYATCDIATFLHAHENNNLLPSRRQLCPKLLFDAHFPHAINKTYPKSNVLNVVARWDSADANVKEFFIAIGQVPEASFWEFMKWSPAPYTAYDTANARICRARAQAVARKIEPQDDWDSEAEEDFSWDREYEELKVKKATEAAYRCHFKELKATGYYDKIKAARRPQYDSKPSADRESDKELDVEDDEAIDDRWEGQQGDDEQEGDDELDEDELDEDQAE
jgi:hypothetical protein